MSKINIKAHWGYSESHHSTYLAAGNQWLGYVMHPDEEDHEYIACIGYGMDAPVIGSGSLSECKKLIMAELT